MKPLYGYVRVSRVGARKKDDGFISPDIQERSMREWAERHGIPVVVQEHELNVSGGTMDRPVFNRIMQAVRTGEAGGVLVYRTDRFARTLAGAVTTLAEIGKHNGAFASVSEPNLDYSTPQGRAFLQMLFVFHEFLRESLKESWAQAAVNAVMHRNVHITPHVPPGYSKPGKGKPLVPNRDAPVIAEAFRKRGRDGWTWDRIADWLNRHAPMPEGRHWTGQAVQRMCSKRVYLGEASRWVVQNRDGREPVVNPNAHPPLVTLAEWEAAQMTPSPTPRPNGPAPLLSELARCAGCSYSLSRGRDSSGRPVYRCRGKHAAGKCPSPSTVMAEPLEAWVVEQVAAAIEGRSDVAGVRLIPTSEDRDRIAAQLETARADLEAFRRDREARRKLGDDAWHDWLDDYLGAVRDLERELARTDEAAGIARFAATAEELKALDQDDLREVLAGFIDCVFLRRPTTTHRGRHARPVHERALILWKGQAPDNLPRRRVLGTIRTFDWPEGHIEARVASAQDAG